MAMNWNRWIKREWYRVAIAAGAAAENAPAFTVTPSATARSWPPYVDIKAVFEHYRMRAVASGRGVEIETSTSDSAAYNMARCVWLAAELDGEMVLGGWRLNAARRRAFDRFNFTLVPLGRSIGLAVRASRAVHGDAAWNIVRCKWLESCVGHLVLTGAPAARADVRTVAERAVAGEPGPAEILNWLDLTYGVEIECIRPTDISMVEWARRLTEAGIPAHAEPLNHNMRTHWKIVPDGSLSDRRGVGMEVVSPILRGLEGFETIRKVSEILIGENRARPICRINRTCGLHVHVGLPRREPRLPASVVRIYSHYESVIDSLMPLSRRANSYCRGGAYNARMGSATTVDSLRSAYGYDRYRKVNLESIGRHGTVEFRHHAGTVEAEKIINWATFCLKLMAVANSAPPLPEGPATLDGLLGLVGADDAATAFWTRRAALLSPADARAAA